MPNFAADDVVISGLPSVLKGCMRKKIEPGPYGSDRCRVLLSQRYRETNALPRVSGDDVRPRPDRVAARILPFSITGGAFRKNDLHPVEAGRRAEAVPLRCRG